MSCNALCVRSKEKLARQAVLLAGENVELRERVVNALKNSKVRPAQEVRFDDAVFQQMLWVWESTCRDVAKALAEGSRIAEKEILKQMGVSQT